MPYIKVVVDGTLAQGAERWSAGWVYGLGPGDAPSPGVMGAFASAALELFRSATGWAASVKGAISSAGTVTRVRAYYYPDPGLPATVVGQSTGASVNGVSTPTLPPQCSLVVTLQTGLAGRTRRGRFYWPLCGGGITSGQRTALASQAQIDAFRDMLLAIESICPGSTPELAVASESAGSVTTVTSIALDDVVDTQRRRRDKLVGTRFTSAV